MECKKDKCALQLAHPKSNASLACDCDCYFKEEPSHIKMYIKRFPTIMKNCGF